MLRGPAHMYRVLVELAEHHRSFQRSYKDRCTHIWVNARPDLLPFDTIQRIISKGIERQEIRPGVDPDMCATIFIATLEGSVMLSKLYQDPVHMCRAAEHVKGYIETNLRPKE